MASLTPGSNITPSLRLVRPLGSGGMGSVWIADHLGLHTQVVVKFMSESLASSPDALARFSREAAAASLVKSPHVVHMIDHGVTQGNLPFIAMELLDGQDLRQRLELEHVLPPRQVATVLTQAAKALTRAHERGVVHRDIKPDNIFLSDGGGEAFVKVLDFGVAKVGDPQLSHTKTGAAVGTPYYMSPEQTMGSKTLDHRTDVWSLGVVAFEALTGKRPFDGDTIGALAISICHSALPSPTQVDPSLPAELDAWFRRACHRDVEGRFASAKELAEAFEAAVGGSEGVPFVRSRHADDAHAPTLEVPSGEGTEVDVTAKTATSNPPGPMTPARSGPVATTTGGLSEKTPEGRPRSRAMIFAGAAAAVALLGGAALVLKPGVRVETSTPVAASAAPAASPAVSVAGSFASSSAMLVELPAPDPSSAPSASASSAASSGASVAASAASSGRALVPAAVASSQHRGPPTPATATTTQAADPFGSGRK